MTRRKLYPPPKDIQSRPIPMRTLSAREWFRCHVNQYGPIHFSYRDYHRFSPASQSPPVLYLASTAETALMEVFGDSLFDDQKHLPNSRWKSLCLSTLSTCQIRVCDLTHSDTLIHLGVDYGTLMGPDISLCQQWADALFHHEEQPDALLYRSRFTNETCMTLSETAAEQISHSHLVGLNLSKEADDFLDRHQIALL